MMFFPVFVHFMRSERKRDLWQDTTLTTDTNKLNTHVLLVNFKFILGNACHQGIVQNTPDSDDNIKAFCSSCVDEDLIYRQKMEPLS